MKTRTNVFKRNLKAFNQLKNKETIIVNQGGQGSSKTRSIIQLLIILALSKKRHITITSYALPHLKAGAMMEFDLELAEIGMNPFMVKNIAESIYYLGESKVEFIGIRANEARVTGPRRDILYVNEAEKNIDWKIFDAMNGRTHEMTFIDFNPAREFWFHDKIMPNFPYYLIKSTYRDNPYLPARELANILSKKDRPGFENWWRVYGEGELGQLEDAIINYDFGEYDESIPYGFGLDFGFNNPDAMVKCSIDHKNFIMYWYEKIYKEGNSIEQLRDLISPHCTRNDEIIADSASPRLIKELAKYFNVKPVNKQKFSVSEALKLMQGYNHIITEDSVNLMKEMNSYIWHDKKANVPIDDFNHLIDAGRYYFMEHSKVKYQQVWHIK